MNATSLSLPVWIDLASEFFPTSITLVIGFFGACIAFNQYKTNRDKLRLDLFDKRLEAYEKLQEYFGHIFRKAKGGDEARMILIAARYKSLFLFDDDISDHINDVWNKFCELEKIDLKLFGENSLPVGQERSELAERKRELLEWNYVQQKESPKRYSKYLKFK